MNKSSPNIFKYNLRYIMISMKSDPCGNLLINFNEKVFPIDFLIYQLYNNPRINIFTATFNRGVESIPINDENFKFVYTTVYANETKKNVEKVKIDNNNIAGVQVQLQSSNDIGDITVVSRKIKKQNPWICNGRVNVPLRVNDNGDIECMSTDNTNCMWQSTQQDCDSLIGNLPPNINPLSCGNMHKSRYGITGYDTEGHWCKTQLNRCQDQDKNCSDWAKKGECTNNPAYMLNNCPVSCGSCDLPNNFTPLKI